MSNLKPLFIAIFITLIIQGVNMMIPYPDVAIGDNQETATVPTKLSKTSNILTASSDTSKTAVVILKDLNPSSYLSSLPFTITSEDEKKVLNHFDTISHHLAKDELTKVNDLTLEIESILKNYWFKKSIKEKFLSFDIQDNFLIQSDYINLKSKKKNILEMDKSQSTKKLFGEISLFVSEYYRSINNILTLYKKEIVSNKLIRTRIENGSVIKENKLVSKPDFNYETFLYSRAFGISDKDMNDLYTVYENYKKTGKDEFIKEIHSTLKAYWLKKSTVDNFIPIESYKSTIYSFLKDEDIDNLNSIYEKMNKFRKNGETIKMLDQMILYNSTIGKLVSESYINQINSYDLKKILLHKGA